jgi:hypothetical protein
MVWKLYQPMLQFPPWHCAGEKLNATGIGDDENKDPLLEPWDAVLCFATPFGALCFCSSDMCIVSHTHRDHSIHIRPKQPAFVQILLEKCISCYSLPQRRWNLPKAKCRAIQSFVHMGWGLSQRAKQRSYHPPAKEKSCQRTAILCPHGMGLITSRPKLSKGVV